jgi:hypothetical protein
MKLKITLALMLIAGLSPALATAQRQNSSIRQHGSSIHDRSPHIHSHETQPHH